MKEKDRMVSLLLSHTAFVYADRCLVTSDVGGVSSSCILRSSAASSDFNCFSSSSFFHTLFCWCPFIIFLLYPGEPGHNVHQCDAAEEGRTIFHNLSRTYPGVDVPRALPTRLQTPHRIRGDKVIKAKMFIQNHWIIGSIRWRMDCGHKRLEQAYLWEIHWCFIRNHAAAVLHKGDCLCWQNYRKSSEYSSFQHKWRRKAKYWDFEKNRVYTH